MTTRIYHNPRCSKSRETLSIIEETTEDVDIIEYLQDVPSAEELDELCTLLGAEPLEIIRTKEDRFKELGLSKRDERSREDWLKLMVENPILIERPIVVRGGKAVMGRPPENVFEIL